MRAVQRQNDSLDLLCRHVAELERQRREPGQQELWQERLSTLQHWICELLIDNELLRASGKTSTSFQPEADPGHAVGIVTPAMVTLHPLQAVRRRSIGSVRTIAAAHAKAR